ncbi:NitT/TauT family transport system substrate-binding protein [Microbacterium ginsengiterrae]|uniref:NitT/TauT family transport system substrate-binding protein n=1 Tax=Microbacterium ginsengiterrae TaxID=546115 RepID=A0A7W9CCC2_9MICO|nr:ABC transporter substrate-binding protein [Microbacterium ginsengiterrae]MBB5742908.1 NitT/TauT family transport system substrate-binding protein [Microbacterium ginsengiterrae]
MNSRFRRILAVSAAAALATSLVACSGSSDAGGDASEPSEGPTAITVATYPVMSNAAVYIGVEEGIFADNGLDVTLETITSGPDSVPTLLSGDLTFTSIDVPTLINATKEDVGLVAVGAMMVGVDVDRGYVGVVAAPDKGIEDWADLEGKKVGVNALGSTPVALISASMEAVGADPSTVQWVQIAQPETIPALQAGQLDAANLAQPLLTAAEEAGFEQVGNPEQLTVGGVPTFLYVTTREYAEKNPEVVAAFQESLNASGEIANGDHELAIETAKKSTTVDPAVLDKVTGLPMWGSKPLTTEDLQKFIDVLVNAGQLDESDASIADQMIWNG